MDIAQAYNDIATIDGDIQTNLRALTDSWLKTSGPSQISCDFKTNDQTLKITKSFSNYWEKVFREL